MQAWLRQFFARLENEISGGEIVFDRRSPDAIFRGRANGGDQVMETALAVLCRIQAECRMMLTGAVRTGQGAQLGAFL